MKTTILSLACAMLAGTASAVSINPDSIYLEDSLGSPVMVGYWQHSIGDPVTQTVFPIAGWGTMTLIVANDKMSFFFQPDGEDQATLTVPLDGASHVARLLVRSVSSGETFNYRASGSRLSATGPFAGSFSHARAAETGPGAALLGVGLVGAGLLRRRAAQGKS